MTPRRVVEDLNTANKKANKQKVRNEKKQTKKESHSSRSQVS
ncbi:hypothetical protein SAMN05444380_108134 [Thermophagus xiamenensis]|uniref:Uncharacterized protein n=1 Tax=Thermophagus xiamenensis TaxID=385682 RepID=A0A1I1YV13_9BACT|nr:hypothetical protein SAMN05444380_108134 [Thermophagus xiamenensis]